MDIKLLIYYIIVVVVVNKEKEKKKKEKRIVALPYHVTLLAYLTLHRSRQVDGRAGTTQRFAFTYRQLEHSDEAGSSSISCRHRRIRRQRLQMPWLRVHQNGQTVWQRP